jgi:G3E family GTPase
MTAPADPRLPLTLLTGFLGSGKSTVLNRLLQRPELADTAVIINEFGEIGLDHLLVNHASEQLRVLNNGCLCCTVRGDLVDALQGLHARRARGEISFSRVMVETTGLADPAPLLHTLMAEPSVATAFRLAAVVSTVDAVNAAATLARHAEAQTQAAVADVLLLTKTDLATAATVQALRLQLQQLNPTATVYDVLDGDIAPERVLDLRWNPFLARVDAAPAHPRHHAHHHHAHHDVHHHDPRIRAHCFSWEAPLHEAAFLHWLDLMAAMRGERLLRVKGLVQLAEHPEQPLVVHGAQHVFHPPQRLPAWPSADRRTRLVFITQDLARDEIARTFAQFAAAVPALV